MPVPHSPEPEWIELYNQSDSASSLVGCTLHDATSKVNLPAITIAAHGFAILCKDTTALLSVRSIDADALLIKVSLPSLNNTTESIRLSRHDSTTIDSVYYDMKWGENGRSLERRRADVVAYSEANIGPCLLPSGASCGSFNSQSPVEFDIKAASIRIDSLRRTIVTTIQNAGIATIHDAEFEFSVNGEPVQQRSISSIGSEDSISFEFPLDSLAQSRKTFGWQKAVLICKINNDHRDWNDSLELPVYFAPPVGSLLINEFMFDPQLYQSEFVELYNSSDLTIPLEGLCLSDESEQRMQCKKRILIPPRAYVVLGSDSLLLQAFPYLTSDSLCEIAQGDFSLNSTTDRIRICDPYGRCLDSLRYQTEWHSSALKQTKGISLEKKNPGLVSELAFAWTSCTDSVGATPGRINSVARALSPDGILDFSPNPFSPRSAFGQRQSTVISFHIPFSSARIFLSVYDINGLLLCRLMNAVYCGSEGHWSWDGTNEAHFALNPGMYVVALEAVDLNSEAVFRKAGICVISE